MESVGRWSRPTRRRRVGRRRGRRRRQDEWGRRRGGRRRRRRRRDRGHPQRGTDDCGGDGEDDQRAPPPCQLALCGLLDEAIRRHRQRQRRSEPGQQQGGSIEAGPSFVEQDDRRPVPQVDAVGDDAEQPDRSECEHSCRQARTVVEEQTDDRGDGNRVEQEPAGVEPAIGGAVDGDPRPRDECCRSQPDPRRRTRLGDLWQPCVTSIDDDRQCGADENRAHPSTGAEVRTRHVVAGEDREQCGRTSSEHDGGREEAGPPAAAAEHRDGEQRPDQVELLLDRQAPHVFQR